MNHIRSVLFRERSVNVGFFKKAFVFFLNSIYIYTKKKGFKPMSGRQNVASYTARLRSQFYWPVYILIMISRCSGSPGLNCWTSVVPAFQSWFAVEYSSCFISVMIPDLHVRCFDSLMRRGPSSGPNNFYVNMNHSRT